MNVAFIKLLEIENTESVQLDTGESSFIVDALKSAKCSCIGTKTSIKRGLEYYQKVLLTETPYGTINRKQVGETIASFQQQIEEQEFYIFRIEELVKKLKASK